MDAATVIHERSRDTTGAAAEARGPDAEPSFVVPARPVHAVTLLNALCLDAPLVAVTWQWLFAHTFRVEIDWAPRLILFLSAWIIYLADRLVDTARLQPGLQWAGRQTFCRRHHRECCLLLAVILIADAFLILTRLEGRTVACGIVLAMAAGIYLVANYPSGATWKRWPIKEASIGVLFAGGTMLCIGAAVYPFNIDLGLSAIAFAMLGALNCISIAVWERDLDLEQGKTSLATSHPAVGRRLPVALVAFAVACAALAVSGIAVPVFACGALSALLLLLLDLLACCIDRDTRTALADLVLLTPLLLLVSHIV